MKKQFKRHISIIKLHVYVFLKNFIWIIQLQDQLKSNLQSHERELDVGTSYLTWIGRIIIFVIKYIFGAISI
jgi:hypothetical protein